jgi:hypothetical protein
MVQAVGFSFMFPWYQIITAITFVLCLIPIPAQWRAGNVATVSMGLWNAGGNLIALINTLVWRGNLRNLYPIWGDITAFYWTNLGIAIASCTLSLTIRIYQVSVSRKMLITREQVSPIYHFSRRFTLSACSPWYRSETSTIVSHLLPLLGGSAYTIWTP